MAITKIQCLNEHIRTGRHILRMLFVYSESRENRGKCYGGQYKLPSGYSL